MRRRGARAVAWSLGASAWSLAAASGCSPDKPTELVPGALSQVAVPRDLDGIEIEVKADGQLKFCGGAQVYDGKVELPRTLGVVSGGSNETIVTVTVRGFSNSLANPNFLNCNDGVRVGDVNGPAVLRRNITTFVGQRTLYLPMSLSYSCFSTDCSGDGSAASGSTAAGSDTTSCQASRCIDVGKSDPKAVAAKLADFTPTLVSGTDVCFSPSRCFSDRQPAFPVSASSEAGASAEAADGSDGSAAPATGVDGATPIAPGDGDCTFRFLVPPPGTGMNVRIYYQDMTWPAGARDQALLPVPSNAGEVEILSLDGAEGFWRLAADPSQFTLAPGLCDLYKAALTPPAPPASGATSTYHTISAIEMASACEPKAPLLPICAGEANPPAQLADGGLTPNLPDGGTTTNGTCNVASPLVPAPSTAYLVMDDSSAMQAAFGPHGSATAMGLSLSDPVFKRTYAAFTFLSHDPQYCSATPTPYAAPSVPFALAATAQTAIATKLANWMAPGDTPAAPTPLELGAAMRLDAGAYKEILDFLANREAPGIAAAIFFMNRIPDPTPGTGSDCPVLFNPPTTAIEAARTAMESAVASAASLGLQTYFVVLGNPANDPAPLAFFRQIETDLPKAVTTLDATSSDQRQVLLNFSRVVTRLGTCLYETPAGLENSSTALLSFSLSGLPPETVPFDAACSEATQSTAAGWNIDPPPSGASSGRDAGGGQGLPAQGRIRICGAPCDDLRALILTSSAQAYQMNAPSPDVPVSLTSACVEADGGLLSGALAGGGSGADSGGSQSDATAGGLDASGIAIGDASAAGLDASGDAASDVADVRNVDAADAAGGAVDGD